MIGFIKGKVKYFDNASIVIDTQGVGYKVTVPSEVLGKAKINQEIEVYTYTHVREDALELFGFSDPLDLKLFEQIIGVSGIGPRIAVNIFSFGNRDSIISAIAKADVSFFTAIPRLGTKNAQKLIIELKSKVGSLEELDLLQEGDGEAKEVLAVLKSFGFSSKEAGEALKNIDKKIESVEEKIRLALKYLGK
ncbi:MAG: Holliday junction DNA helicase RuvA [Candidatus Levybacteria bacterium RIFCSPLOWO2_01_FULL_38_13]|nr:MAG: Holliday junction DNA helicase RuvA [Candidatus Levybacteria bacterium RIFCSPHIGHO2_01_FULL_41_15]OGH35768.1 MAG: Holliday junction DNA helicase RuvA [Candidatus Levybacteria bacterium RIFCSPLOWO2_01_FULL_38_13]